MPTWRRRSLVPSETAYLEQNIGAVERHEYERQLLGAECWVSSVRSWPDQASARAFAGAGLRASALPNCFAVMVRLTEAGIQAFMIRLSRPGMILERFTRNAFRSSDTHCSTLRGFIGMVRGSNPATERQGNPPDQFAGLRVHSLHWLR
jgi:hypothetical protein